MQDSPSALEDRNAGIVSLLLLIKKVVHSLFQRTRAKPLKLPFDVKLKWPSAAEIRKHLKNNPYNISFADSIYELNGKRRVHNCSKLLLGSENWIRTPKEDTPQGKERQDYWFRGRRLFRTFC
jgi:hypothetical protein